MAERNNMSCDWWDRCPAGFQGIGNCRLTVGSAQQRRQNTNMGATDLAGERYWSTRGSKITGELLERLLPSTDWSKRSECIGLSYHLHCTVKGYFLAVTSLTSSRLGSSIVDLIHFSTEATGFFRCLFEHRFFRYFICSI